jgi:hypothetical protein
MPYENVAQGEQLVPRKPEQVGIRPLRVLQFDIIDRPEASSTC